LVTDSKLAVGQRELHGAAAFARNGRDAIHRGLEVLLVDDSDLSLFCGMTRP
jgi:hypothetical protein